MAVSCSDVVWNDGAPLTVYRSSDRAERAFCSLCGSNLYWHGEGDAPSVQALALMAFDRPEDFAVTREIYVDDKLDSYALAGMKRSLTGAELHAGSAASAERTV